MSRWAVYIFLDSPSFFMLLGVLCCFSLIFIDLEGDFTCCLEDYICTIHIVLKSVFIYNYNVFFISHCLVISVYNFNVSVLCFNSL